MVIRMSHSALSIILLICSVGSLFFASAASKTYQWKKMYQFPLEGKNIAKECKLPNGSPICCSALDGHFVTNKTDLSDRRKKRRSNCRTTRVYESSDYEKRHLEAAQTVKGVGPLWSFVQSSEEMKAAKDWLADVKSLMTEEHYGTKLEPNTTHLSRFIVTEECNDAAATTTIEYIEPISITARHPFAWSYSGCDNNVAKKGFKKWASKETRTHLCDTDFVVLANKKWTQNAAKRYFFDAGSSTFDSSGWWFMCGYSQVGVVFDHAYSYEYTLLEPEDYWSRVPMKYKSRFSFFNVPASADPNSENNPLRLIKTTAKPKDFVSFKLDIDTPAIENPMAYDILSNPTWANLIDEFFFELHFDCEIMNLCAWVQKGKRTMNGEHLYRHQALQFFLHLRQQGIRAHIWV